MDRAKVIIHRSNTSLEAQAQTDGKSVAGKRFKFAGKVKPVEQAKEFGKEFAKILSDKKIKQIAFDRNGFRYHGRVRAFAEGLREEGIEF